MTITQEVNFKSTCTCTLAFPPFIPSLLHVQVRCGAEFLVDPVVDEECAEAEVGLGRGCCVRGGDRGVVQCRGRG